MRQFSHVYVSLSIGIGISICALLSGCIAPKPQMTNAQYQNAGKLYASVQLCGQVGQLSPDSALWAKRMLNANIMRYSYDAEAINSNYRMVMAGNPTPPVELCNTLAMKAAEYKQNVQDSNAQVEEDTRAWQNQIQQNRPVTTYCNKVGTQTLCNSY